MIKALRGAISVEKNKKDVILFRVTTLMKSLIEKNNISEKDIVSIQFSVTSDLNAINPATALRTIGFSNVALFCCQEPKIKGSLKRIVRVLITLDIAQERALAPIYLGEAKKLRPDLFSDRGTNIS